MATNQKLTYQDLGREIAEMVDPNVAFQTQLVSPFLMTVLGFPGRLGNTFSTKHEWLEERLAANSTLVNGAQTNVETTIEVTAGTGTRFAVGDHVQVDGSREIMLVGTANANDIVVTRAFLGTTNVAILDGATIMRIANPTLEKVAGGNPLATDRQRRVNFTQIFRREICVSRSRKKVRNLGTIADEVAHQLERQSQDLIRDLAKSVVNEREHNTTPEGSDAIPRTMNGIIYQILDGASVTGGDPSIVSAGGVGLDQDLLDDLLRDVYEKGGRITHLIPSTRQYEALAATIEGRRRYTSTESIAGGRVSEYVSKWGDIVVTPGDIFVPADVILAVDASKLALLMLGDGSEPFERFDQGKDGTSDEVITEGEFTLEAKNASDGGHGLLQGLSII